MSTRSKQPLSRETLLRLGAYFINNPRDYERMVEEAGSKGDGGDVVAQRELIIIREWAAAGAQSIELPHTYAAALMATDPYGAIEGQRLPWPAFEIIVPQGMLTSSHGPIFSVKVSEVPKRVILMHEMTQKTKLMLCYHDTESGGVLNLKGIDWLCKADGPLNDVRMLDQSLQELYNPEIEDRIWAMLQRLVANVIIAINTKRADKPEAYPTRPMKAKNGEPKANLHRLGAPMKIDFRNHITEFVSGIKRSAPSTTTLVRGHYRHQAHGPGWQKHRWIRIEPFLRGDGPMIPRPTKLVPPEEQHEST